MIAIWNRNRFWHALVTTSSPNTGSGPPPRLEAGRSLSHGPSVLSFTNPNADDHLELSTGNGSLLLLAASSLMPAAEQTGLENDNAANRLAMARALLARNRVNLVGRHSNGRRE